MEKPNHSPVLYRVLDEVPSLRILDYVPAIIYVSDNTTKTIRWCNRHMEKITGYTLQEMNSLGINFFRAIMHPDDFPNAIKAREGFRGGKKEFTGVCRIKGKTDAKWKWLYGIAVPFTYDEEGQVKEVICIFQELKGMDTPVQIHKAFNFLLRSEMHAALEELTPQEMKVFEALLQRKKHKEITQELYIETTTLKTHKKHLREKLGADNFELLIAFSRITGGGVMKIYKNSKNHPPED